MVCERRRLCVCVCVCVWVCACVHVCVNVLATFNYLTQLEEAGFLYPSAAEFYGKV